MYPSLFIKFTEYFTALTWISLSYIMFYGLGFYSVLLDNCISLSICSFCLNFYFCMLVSLTFYICLLANQSSGLILEYPKCWQSCWWWWAKWPLSPRVNDDGVGREPLTCQGSWWRPLCNLVFLCPSSSIGSRTASAHPLSDFLASWKSERHGTFMQDK